MMKEYFPILKPTIVTICYGWNDHWAAGFDIEDKEQKMPPQFLLDMQNDLSESYLYRTIKYLLLSNYERQKEYTYDRKSPKYRVSLVDYRANLEAMIDYCRENSTTPIVITSPAGDADPLVENGMERYHSAYNDVAREVAASKSVALVDAAAVFRDHPEYYDDPRKDLIHYNAFGAAKIAAMIAGQISRQ